MADEADIIYGFNSADTDELLSMIGSNHAKDSQQDTYDATRLVLAYTTAGATARSGSTLGVGTATIYYLAVSGSDRVLSTTGVSVTFYNMASSAVGALKYLMLLRAGDVFVCNWEDC